MNDINIEIVRYSYDTSYAGPAEEYIKLCAALRERGLKKLDYLERRPYMERMEVAVPEGKHRVETKHLFNNQYNTETHRVFEWSECIFPNKNIKEGYYIKDTEGFRELKELAKRTYQCGYCGHQTIDIGSGWCKECMGLEYLTENDYSLLELKPVTYTGKRDKPIPKKYLSMIRERQEKSRMERMEREAAKRLADLQRDIENSKKEYAANKWLIEHDMDYNNMIYYDHTDTFSFGWRDPIEEKDKLREKLEGFPYEYEIR